VRELKIFSEAVGAFGQVTSRPCCVFAPLVPLLGERPGCSTLLAHAFPHRDPPPTPSFPPVVLVGRHGSPPWTVKESRAALLGARGPPGVDLVPSSGTCGLGRLGHGVPDRD